MHTPEKRPDPFFRVAQLALVLTLAVVLAAAIRHGVHATLFRPVHRVAASLDVLAALWLAWLAWRARGARPDLFRAALVALVITALLSAIGVAGGQNPPPAIAVANLLGGLALAAAFAWMLARAGAAGRQRGWAPFMALLALQLGLGAWVSIRGGPFVLPLHALLAMLLAGALAWLALARVQGLPGRVLFAVAMAAPLAGMTALHYEYSALATLVHTVAAAALVCATAFAVARGA